MPCSAFASIFAGATPPASGRFCADEAGTAMTVASSTANAVVATRAGKRDLSTVIPLLEALTRTCQPLLAPPTVKHGAAPSLDGARFDLAQANLMP